jgi:uncharacterized protein (UPF0248 family)
LDNKKDIGLYVLFRTVHDNFQVKLFPPKNIFFNIFFKYSLNIYANVFNIFKFELNPLDNKKDISIYVLFRTFQVNFQDISVTRIRQLQHLLMLIVMAVGGHIVQSLVVTLSDRIYYLPFPSMAMKTSSVHVLLSWAIDINSVNMIETQ